MRARVRLIAFAITVLLAGSAAWFSFAADASHEGLSVDVHAIPLYPDRPNDRRTGRLIYRGGVEIASDDDRFGGLSDIAVSDDGKRILAVSDNSFWFRARLVYDSEGDLTGLTDAEMAPMLNLAGTPMHEKEGDAEGLAAVVPGEPWGSVLVSFERNVRVWRYDLAHGLNATPTAVPVGDWAQHLKYNEELEAITLLTPDTIFAIAEVSPDDTAIPAALEAYPGDPAHRNTRPLSVARRAPFAITSVATARDGQVFILERRFSLLGGFGMEIRRFDAADISPGALIQGDVIANLAGGDSNIDNMEGIAVRRGPHGETLLYVVSDDNYNVLERTVLMMFELVQ